MKARTDWEEEAAGEEDEKKIGILNLALGVL